MKIGFIGGGNMAAALIGGLRKQGIPGSAIHVVERDAGRRDALATEFGVTTTDTPDRDLLGAAVLVLAVKPGQIREVCEALDAPAGNRLLVSIAAGIPSASIARWARTGSVVRAMPNTPALVQSGATGLYANPRVRDEQRRLVEQVLGAVGITLWVEHEDLIDAVTAVSGSGPAYFFQVMEAMIAAGTRLGLDPRDARALTLQTALGAAQMAIASDVDPAELRRRVTSPGGTTEQAVRVFAQADLNDIFLQAMTACAERGGELAAELGARD